MARQKLAHLRLKRWSFGFECWDLVIEIGITPNRPDCLACAALPAILAAAGLGTAPEAGHGDCDISAKADRRADWLAMSGPVWLALAGCLVNKRQQWRKPGPDSANAACRAIGLSPINAPVDLYRLSLPDDRGRPLHVYGCRGVDRSGGGAAGRSGRKPTALDDNVYELAPEDCVIAMKNGVLGPAVSWVTGVGQH